MMQEMR